MDIDAMLAFVTIVNTGSFSAAAKKLHITQPAISKRIHNLEQRLNIKLFERLQREIKLTEAGNTLLPHARAILHEFDNAKTAVKDLDQRTSGPLRIVASHHIGLHRLPMILRDFSQRFPEVDLQLIFLDSESAYALLQDNSADLAFITIPDVIRDEYECHLTWDDPMSFICGKAHPLAELEQVSPRDLARYNAILPSESTLTYRVVETIFKQHRLKLKASIPTNYLETMKMMASVGMGWSVLPNTMIEEDLKVLALEKPKLSRRLGAISFRKKTLGNAARAFINTAETVWGKL